MRNNDNIAKVNDDDGSCLGWSLGPTLSACLTVALLKPNYCRNFFQLLAASTSHYQHLLPLLLSVLKNFKLLAVVYLVQIPLTTHLKVNSAQSTKKGKKAKEGEEQMRGPMGTQDMIQGPRHAFAQDETGTHESERR